MAYRMVTNFLVNYYYSLEYKFCNFFYTYAEYTYHLASKLPAPLSPFGYLLSGSLIFTVGYLPFYLTYLIGMFYLQNKILSNMNSDVLYKLFYSFYIVQLFLFLTLIFLRPAFIERDEKIEAYIKDHRKEMKSFFCNPCGISKIMRSFHCIYCDKCVAKWQVHTFWFNRCIDARNLFTYWLYLSVCLLLNVTSIGSCFYYNHIRTKEMLKPFIYVVLLIIQLVTLWKELYKYTKLIAENMTILEDMNWYKAIYMWADESRAFFNPFDLGVFNNFRQAIKGTFTCKKTPTTYELIELNTTRIGISLLYPIEEQKEDTEISIDSPSSENIIRPHDGTWIPNWVTYRIYNIFDITNSPMREKVLAYHQAKVAQSGHNEP